MTAIELLSACNQAGKRTHLIGDLQAGVIIVLDMEGRLFTVRNGKILNRVNPKAIAERGTLGGYLNPGGDVLWPAPEGTSLGYQYSTGSWRVAPGLRSVRYTVDKIHKRGATITGEVDLINNKGHGIPAIFKRRIHINTLKNEIIVHVLESITYIGNTMLTNRDCLLAPWSLCQFDAGPECEVVFPCSSRSSVWDLYSESGSGKQRWTKSFCHAITDGTSRFQIGLDKEIPWIRFCDHKRGLYVRRDAEILPGDQSYIDIRDVSPHVEPAEKGVRYSIYNDPDNFMEIEAVGGCPASINPGTELSIRVTTRFRLK
jgi:hypothetical protein